MLDSGIIRSKAYGGVDSVYSTCALSDEVKGDSDHTWMKHFDRVSFEAELLRQCAGESACAPEFERRHFADGDIQQEPGLVLFAQVSCKQTEETLLWKNLVGMLAACLGLLMIAHFQASISRLQGKFRIDKAIMPLQQSTVDNYSAYCTFPVSLYEYWRNNYQENSISPSRLLAFKRMLEDQIKLELKLDDEKSFDKDDAFADKKDDEK